MSDALFWRDEFAKVRYNVIHMLTGFSMTVVLFLVMHLVVAPSAEIEPLPVVPAPPITLVNLPPEKAPPPPPPRIEPPKIERQPEVVIPIVTGGSYAVIPTVAPVRPVLDAKPSLMSDGELARILAVAPEYPRRQLAQGIEGWVLLEFSVDELGRVVHPQVLDAQPATVFNAAALRALQRYKYRPRVVDGKAMKVSGIRQRISFELD